MTEERTKAALDNALEVVRELRDEGSDADAMVHIKLEMLFVLDAEVRRLRAELSMVNIELGALQFSAGNVLDVLRGSYVRGLRAILARSLCNANRTGIKKKRGTDS